MKLKTCGVCGKSLVSAPCTNCQRVASAIRSKNRTKAYEKIITSLKRRLANREHVILELKARISTMVPAQANAFTENM